MSLGYAALADRGIDMSWREAQEALRAGGYEVGDVHPLKARPCTTMMHKGDKQSEQKPATFRLTPMNGHPTRYVCRYCLFIAAHARQKRNSGLWLQLVESARESIAPEEAVR